MATPAHRVNPAHGGEPGKDAPQEAVLYTPQTLTKDQQAQARENVGAADLESVNGLKGDMPGKLSEPAEGLAVGKYFRVAAIDENGHAVLEAVDAKDVGVQDVQVDGASVVEDGVANIPIATNDSVGAVRTFTGYGTQMIGNIIGLVDVTEANIDNRDNGYRSISTKRIDYVVKAAMCDGKGAAWTADEQAAARVRMGEFTDSPLTTVADITLDESATILRVQLAKSCRFVTCTFIIPPESTGQNRNIYFAANIDGVPNITTMFARSAPVSTSLTNYAFYFVSALIIGGKILSFGCIASAGTRITDHQTKSMNNPPNGYCVLDAESFESISVYTYGNAFPAGSQLVITGC